MLEVSIILPHPPNNARSISSLALYGQTEAMCRLHNCRGTMVFSFNAGPAMLPAFNWYMVSLVIDWLWKRGGCALLEFLEKFEHRNG